MVSTLAATAVEGGAKEARARVAGACSLGNGLGATTAVCDSGPIQPDTAMIITPSMPGIRMDDLHPTSSIRRAEKDSEDVLACPVQTVSPQISPISAEKKN
jgi:hypothetical protein